MAESTADTVTPLAPPPVRPGLFARLRARRAEAALFLAMTTLYFFTIFHRVALPGTIFNELQVGFGATAGQITAISAISLYIYAFLQVPVGFAADRWGAAGPLLFGGLFLCAGSIALPLSGSLAALYGAAVLISVGSSFMYLCMIKEIDQLFDASRFAPLLGLLLLLGYIGGLGGTAPLTWAVAAFGWRRPFMVVGVLCTLGLLATGVLLYRANRRHHRAAPLSREALGLLVRTPGIYVVLFFAPLDFGVYMLMQVTLGKKFLEDHCRLTPDKAAGVTFGMLLIVVVGSFLSGLAPALIGQRRRPIALAMAIITFVGAAMLTLGMARDLPAWWFVTACLLMALAASLWTITTTLFKELCPPGATALGIGVQNGLSFLAVAIASHLSGHVMDAYRADAVVTPAAIIYPAAAYRAVFLGLLGASAAALGAAFFVPETGRRRGIGEP